MPGWDQNIPRPLGFVLGMLSTVEVMKKHVQASGPSVLALLQTAVEPIAHTYVLRLKLRAQGFSIEKVAVPCVDFRCDVTRTPD